MTRTLLMTILTLVASIAMAQTSEELAMILANDRDAVMADCSIIDGFEDAVQPPSCYTESSDIDHVRVMTEFAFRSYSDLSFATPWYVDDGGIYSRIGVVGSDELFLNVILVEIEPRRTLVAILVALEPGGSVWAE